MALYTFGESSPIRSVTVRRASSGKERAYLQAGKDVSPETLQSLLRPMREGRTTLDKERNWQFIPTEINGEPVLEVRGFGGRGNLWKSLEQHRLTVGALPTPLPEPEDKIGWGARLHAQALKISGALYIIGDIAFGIYGALGRRETADSAKVAEQFASAFYFGGSVSLLGFARDTSSQKLRDIGQYLKENMARHGLEVDETTAIAQITNSAVLRPIDQAGNFVRKYHSDIMNLSFAGSGVAQIIGAGEDVGELNQRLKLNKSRLADNAALLSGASGGAQANMLDLQQAKIADRIKKDSFKHLNSSIDVGVGVMTGLSGVLTMLTPEKTEEEKAKLAKEKNPIKRAINWFREKPMRISGYGLLSSTVLHFISSVRNLTFSNKVMSAHDQATNGEQGLLSMQEWNDLSKRTDAASKDRMRAHDELVKGDMTRPLLTTGEMDDYHAKKRSFIFRMVFVVTNIIAELLMTVADKGHGETVQSQNDVAKSACAMVAEVIARQPQEKQAFLTKAMAELLASSKELGGKPEDYLGCLREQLAVQRAHPWAVGGHSQPTSSVSILDSNRAPAMDSITTPRPSFAEQHKRADPGKAEASLASLYAIAEAGPMLDKTEQSLRASGNIEQADALVKLQQDVGIAIDRAISGPAPRPEAGPQTSRLEAAYEPVTQERLQLLREWTRGASATEKLQMAALDPAKQPDMALAR